MYDALTVYGSGARCWRHQALGSVVQRQEKRASSLRQRRIVCFSEKNSKDSTDDLLANLDALLGKKPEPKKDEEEKPAGQGPAAASTESQEMTDTQKSTLNELQDQSTFVYEMQEDMEIPKEDIEKLRSTVLGFTFYVTEIDNLAKQGFPGVVFFGNLRKDAETVYDELQSRLKTNFGDKYELYLLADGDRPYVAVTPGGGMQTQPQNTGIVKGVAVASWLLTFLSALQSCGLPVGVLALSLFPSVQTNVPLSSLIAGAAPGAIAFMIIMGLHELGHVQAAKKNGLNLLWPIGLPAFSGSLPAFGAYTIFQKMPRTREQLMDVSLQGPIYGIAASTVAMVVGMVLTKFGVGASLSLPSYVLSNSVYSALFAKLILGNDIADAVQISFNPLVPAAIAGFVVNTLNMLPIGESDGGRLVLSLYGRRIARGFGVGGCLLMIFLGTFEDPAFFFYLFAILLFLRGPTPPLGNEVLVVPQSKRNFAVAALVLVPMLGLTPVDPSVLGLPEPPEIDIEALEQSVQEFRQQQAQQGGVQTPPQQQAPAPGSGGNPSA